MNWLITLLSENQLLILFLVASVGYGLGKINFRGVRLGVAAILFVGLALGAVSPKITLPSIITSLGLAIFVYSLGIASGSTFFASFKKNGFRDMGIVALLLAFAGAITVLIYKLIDLEPSVAAGIFTGSLTNTPSLASIVSLLQNGSLGNTSGMAGLPAVGYSIAYPMGVLGPIIAIIFWQKRYKINYLRDAKKAKEIVATDQTINNQTLKVTNADCCGIPIKNLIYNYDWSVIFSRLQRDGELVLMKDTNVRLKLGDIVTIIGSPEDLRPVCSVLGAKLDDKLVLDRSELDFRRVFVSNKSLVGKSLKELKIAQNQGAIVTRIRRGDIEMLAHRDFVLEYGDRVRFIAPHDKLMKVSKYFGDSYRSISEFHMFAIGLGLVFGLLLGMVPFRLPGGIVFHLGDAGGPLIIGLILGALRRTGPIIWGISYTSNLTLREFGLILMLSGIGVRSGQTFINSLADGKGVPILAMSAIISILIPFLFIPIAYKKLKVPFAIVTGMISAIHTQPAVHAFSVQQAKNDLPNHGYTQIFPIATILKLIISQIILVLLLGNVS